VRDGNAPKNDQRYEKRSRRHEFLRVG
jgi:hypothetical protein